MKPVFKNALISVSNKRGLVECVQSLAQSKTRIVSTGGTARELSLAGISVKEIQEQTLFPELMDGRVKTLHPHVFLPLLARLGNQQDEQELKKRELDHFDLVICNLYPFDKIQKAVEKEQMELVDVGGPSILRASAKNFEKITVICDPDDYSLLKRKTPLDLEERRFLANKVFSYLSVYDSVIASYLQKGWKQNKKVDHSVGGRFFKQLRYGENPHQKSSWYTIPFQEGLDSAQLLQGKELSFNNVLDIQSAVSTLREFKNSPCSVGVKHNNPCGVACADSLDQAVAESIKADPVSIFGGIIALNKLVDLKSAQILKKIFLECIVAPSYSPSALEFLSEKKNLRILQWENLLEEVQNDYSIHTVDGGFLIQDGDKISIDWENYKIEGEKPSASVKKDLEMAWKICSHLKSNAICLVSGQKTIGMGMGQVDRITAVDLAIQRMKKNHQNIKEVVMASDGFFPFSDSVEKAASEGIRWIIQPGGSIRDSQVLESARQLNVNIIITGCRHFKH